jgi:neutral trehalase
MGLSFGWALHQILLWEGLTDYGFEKSKKWSMDGSG